MTQEPFLATKLPPRAALVLFLFVTVVHALGCGHRSDAASTAGVDAGADVVEGIDAPATHDSSSDADFGEPSTVYPAPHATPPTVISAGGDVLVSPLLVPITFMGDTRASDIDAFATSFATSANWSAETGEYGVGAATVGPIHVSEAAPTSITDTGVQAWIAENLESVDAGTGPAWGAPNTDAIYTVFYPPGTNITAPDGASCAKGGFVGYHSQLSLSDQTSIVYAVIAGCSTNATVPWPEPQGLDTTTAVASHEWIEAATDPHIDSSPAYTQPDDGHLGWLIVGGELADMCAFNPGADYVPTGALHAVQRSWSNTSAMTGHDPCVPHVSAEPYFNSAPVQSDDVTFDYFGSKVQTKGVQIAVGTSRTIDVDLFSDGATSDPWSVSAVDVLTWEGQAPELELSFDRTSGVNGEKVHLTLKVLRKDKTFGGEFFAIVSTLGDQSNVWYGLVGN